ncbi:ClpX C4-type zinc finger protein [Serratia sp. IR-2025]
MAALTAEVNRIATHKCSFCDTDNINLKGVIIAGPGVSICQECVLLCVEIVFNHSAGRRDDDESHG